MPVTITVHRRTAAAAASAPSRIESTASGAIQNLLAHSLLLPTGFVIAAFVSRALGPSSYGTLAVATSLVTWLELVIQTVFSSMLVTFVAEAKDWQEPARAGAQAQAGVALAVGLALFVSAPAVASILGDPQLGGDLRLFAIDIPLVSLSYVYGGVLAGKEQFGKNALTIASFWVGRMVFMVGIVAVTHSVAGAIVGTLCASAVRLAVARVFVRVRLWGRSSFPVRRLLSYGSVSIFFAATIPLFDKVGLFLTKALEHDPYAAGYYGAALNLITVPSLLAGTVAPLVVASLTKEIAGGNAEAGRMLVRQGNRMILFVLPFTAVIAASSGGIVEAIYGPAFAPAGPYLTLLSFASAAWAAITMSTALVVAGGRLRGLLALHVPLLPLLVLCGQFGVRTWGGLGAACATLAVGLLGAAFAIFLVQRRYGTFARRRTLCNVLVATGLTFAAGFRWEAPGWWILPKLILLTLVALGALLLLKEFDSGDVWFIRTLTRRFLGPAAAPSPQSQELQGAA
ncbi:MAG TPA: oligosaccharide flippase family protein [Chloroflexota bacterium]|nr:oligosaccharide flippase family protein [Chloroflexota bacterium]